MTAIATYTNHSALTVYSLMVTLFTSRVNIQEFFLSTECIYVFCLGLAVWETVIFFYYPTLADRSLQPRRCVCLLRSTVCVFTVQYGVCVYCAVRTEALCINGVNLILLRVKMLTIWHYFGATELVSFRATLANLVTAGSHWMISVWREGHLCGNRLC